MRINLLQDLPFAIALHLIAALLALPIGAIVLWLPKGTPLHRLLGRVWVGSALVVAFSSFWIQEVNVGQFSPLHLLSAWTLFCLVIAILAIRKRQIRKHRGFMVGSYLGMVGAGLFALSPERMLGGLLW